MSRLVLRNARVITPLETLERGWVEIEGDRIVGVGTARAPTCRTSIVADLDGRFLAPGFIDLHAHGGDGAAMGTGDPEAIEHALRFHLGHGTTGMLASLAAAPLNDLHVAVAAIADVTASSGGRLLGSHLEGPFLSHERRGAQDEASLLAPSQRILQSLIAAGRGTVRMVTLAPELPGALELIALANESNVVVAFGHTAATYEATIAAIAAGASVATHLFNGMSPLHHREPGAVGAALDRREVVCEVIADLVHLHPAVIRAIFRIKGAASVALVTDAVAVAGIGAGDHVIGHVEATVSGGTVTRSSGSLAGSSLTMSAAVSGAVRVGVSLHDAVQAATATPARVLGIQDEVGTIEVGKRADLVALGDDGSVEGVISSGTPGPVAPAWWPRPVNA